MGKKQRTSSPEPSPKVEKKPLRQFLPYNSYVHYKNKLLKKNTS